MFKKMLFATAIIAAPMVMSSEEASANDCYRGGYGRQVVVQRGYSPVQSYRYPSYGYRAPVYRSSGFGGYSSGYRGGFNSGIRYGGFGGSGIRYGGGFGGVPYGRSGVSLRFGY